MVNLKRACRLVILLSVLVGCSPDDAQGPSVGSVPRVAPSRLTVPAHAVSVSAKDRASGSPVQLVALALVDPASRTVVARSDAGATVEWPAGVSGELELYAFAPGHDLATSTVRSKDQRITVDVVPTKDTIGLAIRSAGGEADRDTRVLIRHLAPGKWSVPAGEDNAVRPISTSTIVSCPADGRLALPKGLVTILSGVPSGRLCWPNMVRAEPGVDVDFVTRRLRSVVIEVPTPEGAPLTGSAASAAVLPDQVGTIALAPDEIDVVLAHTHTMAQWYTVSVEDGGVRVDGLPEIPVHVYGALAGTPFHAHVPVGIERVSASVLRDGSAVRTLMVGGDEFTQDAALIVGRLDREAAAEVVRGSADGLTAARAAVVCRVDRVRNGGLPLLESPWYTLLADDGRIAHLRRRGGVLTGEVAPGRVSIVASEGELLSGTVHLQPRWRGTGRVGVHGGVELQTWGLQRGSEWGQGGLPLGTYRIRFLGTRQSAEGGRTVDVKAAAWVHLESAAPHQTLHLDGDEFVRRKNRDR